MSSSKKQRRAPWLAVGLAGMVGFLPMLGWVGGRWWVLDLLNHFQLQYFVTILILVIGLALRSKVRPAIVAALFMVTPAIRLAECWLPLPPSSADPGLRIASFNVLTSNTRHAETEKWIRSERPDFIYLAEADPSWIQALEPLEDEYPHRIAKPVPGNFGFLFLSRHPLRDTHTPLVGRLEIPILDTIVDLPTGPIRVFGAHPVPPVSRFWSSERDLYLKDLAGRTVPDTLPTVIIGDLNATRWSQGMQPLFQQSMTDASRGHGYRATWSRSNPLLAVPIDHILTRDLGSCVDFRVGPNLGSDHRAVVADIALKR